MADTGRRILAVLDEGRVRRWHYDLLTGLDTHPNTEVWITWSTPRRRRTIRDLSPLSGQRLASGGTGGAALIPDGSLESRFPDRMVERTRRQLPDGRPDVVVHLAGDERDATRYDADAVLAVTYDGVAGDLGAASSVAGARCPWVEIVDLAAGRAVVARGRPGSDLPTSRGHLADGIASGARVLLDAALGGRMLHCDVEAACDVNGGSRSVAHRLAGNVGRAVYRRVFFSPHWRVGWRFVDGEDVLDRGSVDGLSWSVLPDDGFHFYADPFPVERDGRHHVFVEDFDHRVGRASISVVEIGPNGPSGAPQPVVESDAHLSYPWIGEDEGETWMIPESADRCALDLYRAVDYPYEWCHHSTLLEGVPIRDATPFRHGGRWWMAATVCHGGAASDTLHLWSAPRLQGPWTPHRSNPVLIDIGSARPAGRVVERDGRILRPVQDGRLGYGASLGIAEITRLDDGVFEQRIVKRLRAGGSWRGTRLHTVNRAGRLECIDGSARSARLRRGRRP